MNRRRFRFLNRLYAIFAGYFWLPCPMCGQMFGGHESGGTLWSSGTPTSRSGALLCWRHPESFVPQAFDGYRTDEDVELSA